MDIVKTIEDNYRKNPKHGVQFSIDGTAYECDREVEFGESTKEWQCGTLYNWQSIIMGGKVIGVLQEASAGRMFDPIVSSFCVCLVDCTDREGWKAAEKKYKDNPHFCDSGEVLELRFATLQQLVDYVSPRT